MRQSPTPRGHVTERQAALILDVPIVRLRTWRTEQIGPPVTRRGGRVFYDAATLRRWARRIDPGTRHSIERKHMKRKKSGRPAAPTVICGLHARLLKLDRRLSDGDPEVTPHVETMMAEWQFLVRQILKATPETMADATIQLMLACDEADTLRVAVEADDDDHQRAGDLSGVLSRVLRFAASESATDLARIGGRLFLDENSEFPEFDEAAEAA